jgi:hypothetical protein
VDRHREGRGEEFLSDLDRSLDSLDSWVAQRFMASPVSSRVSPIVMSLATISLVDAETLDPIIDLLDAQLREHKITRSRDDLRAVTRTVIADRRHGFILVAKAPDRCCLRKFSTQLGARWSQRLDRRALRLTTVAVSGNRFRLDRGSGCAR